MKALRGWPKEDLELIEQLLKENPPGQAISKFNRQTKNGKRKHATMKIFIRRHWGARARQECYGELISRKALAIGLDVSMASIRVWQKRGLAPEPAPTSSFKFVYYSFKELQRFFKEHPECLKGRTISPDFAETFVHILTHEW